jgi:thiosulfate reductase cytochrome b subunit
LANKLYKPRSSVLAEYRLLNKGLFQDAGLIEKITKAGGKLPEKPTIKYDSADWAYTNLPLMNHVYVVGAVKHKTADRIFLAILVSVAALVVLHGVIRLILFLKRKKSKRSTEDFYLYALWLRAWHWLNAILIVLLLISGYSMHFSGAGNLSIDFHVAVKMHKIAGALLIICYLVFLVGNMADGNIKNYLPHIKGAFKAFLLQIKHYGWGIFKGESCPHHLVAGRKFNPLQKTAYLFLMSCILPVIAVTGILLLIPGSIPTVINGENGRWVVSFIHYCAAALFSMFLIVHLYLITTGDRVLFLLRGMITGYHRSYKAENE